jgi:hypothetical protein
MWVVPELINTGVQTATRRYISALQNKKCAFADAEVITRKADTQESL